MEKKTLMTFLASISCDDVQICVHNWDDIPYSLFNISITDNAERTIELTCGKSTGIIVAKGEFNYETLSVLNIINAFFKAQNHVDYRKEYLEHNSI